MTDKPENNDESRLSDSWLSLEEAIGFIIGAASVAWKDGDVPGGAFDTDQAKMLSTELQRYILTKHDTSLNPNRSKGESIVADCLLGDEPFFVFRARDIFTPMVLKRYLSVLEEYGPDDPDMQSSIVQFIAVLRKWQANNISKVRYPD